MIKTGKFIVHIFGSILLFVIVVYSVITTLFYFFQSRLIYFPDRTIAVTPEAIGLEFEQVNFTAEDGITLSGWFIPAREHRGVLLFCHGNAGNISHRLESIQIFHKLGLSILIFDYRGFGASGGTLSERGTYMDAEAAWDYLTQNRQFSSDEIIIFGRSLGGAIAASLAQHKTPKALILESAFTSVEDLGAELYPFLPVRWLSRFKYSTIDYLANISVPILIIHSRNDDIVPFSQSRRLFKEANPPKEFLEISGSHNDGFIYSGSRYTNSLEAFIAQHVKQ